MAQMRAVLVKNGAGGVENLYIGETPKPSPAAGQVVVKVCRNPFIFFMPSMYPSSTDLRSLEQGIFDVPPACAWRISSD